MDTRVRRRHVLAIALAALLLPIVAACAAPTQESASAPAPEASASPSGALGGSVTYQSDGAPATTEVDAVADGASVSGTAVTTFSAGTHTVQVECASRNGDTWALGGTTEQTTLPGEKAGDWSAVIVKDGSPQHVGIWISDDKAAGIDCDGWLAAIDFATLDPAFLLPVESGELVAPPAP